MIDRTDEGLDSTGRGVRLLAWTVLVVGVLANVAVAFLLVTPRIVAEVPRLQELTAWWPALPELPGPPLLLQLATGVPAVLAAAYLVRDRAVRRARVRAR